MSNYVYNTSLTYPDYLQAKSFVEDVRTDQQAVVCEVPDKPASSLPRSKSSAASTSRRSRD